MRLAPLERRGLQILLAPSRLRMARVEERLERGGEQIAPRPARVWIVRAHDSGDGHAAYRSARRTLCGLRVAYGVRGRGQHSEPSCRVCLAVLGEHRALGLVLVAVSCPALTKHGRRCRREPLPGVGYCPSHKGLADG